MDVIQRSSGCRAIRQSWGNQRVALVPTMGALHEGHMALIHRARAEADRVIVSIFVNPLQFGPTEDLDQYPRSLAEDLRQCEAAGVDMVFHPQVGEMYPNGLGDGAHTFQVQPPDALANRYCGASRPNHFTGVCTIVLKLLNLTQPDVAMFGQKDAQQLAVVQSMVQDLVLPVEIIGIPTVRDTDGLALSSRNRYLSPAERAVAQRIPQLLNQAKDTMQRSGPTPSGELLSQVWETIMGNPWKQAKTSHTVDGVSVRLDYWEGVHHTTFEPTDVVSTDTRLLMACWIGQTRLIDNMLMGQTGTVPQLTSPQALNIQTR